MSKKKAVICTIMFAIMVVGIGIAFMFVKLKGKSDYVAVYENATENIEETEEVIEEKVDENE